MFDDLTIFLNSSAQNQTKSYSMETMTTRHSWIRNVTSSTESRKLVMSKPVPSGSKLRLRAKPSRKTHCFFKTTKSTFEDQKLRLRAKPSEEYLFCVNPFVGPSYWHLPWHPVVLPVLPWWQHHGVFAPKPEAHDRTEMAGISKVHTVTQGRVTGLLKGLIKVN